MWGPLITKHQGNFPQPPTSVSFHTRIVLCRTKTNYAIKKWLLVCNRERFTLGCLLACLHACLSMQMCLKCLNITQYITLLPNIHNLDLLWLYSSWIYLFAKFTLNQGKSNLGPYKCFSYRFPPKREKNKYHKHTSLIR